MYTELLFSKGENYGKKKISQKDNSNSYGGTYAYFKYVACNKCRTALGKNTRTIGVVYKLSSITGYIGSTAEVYSENSGCTFIPLNEVAVGDVDCDEDITISDATELQFFLSKSVSFTKSQIALSDVNGDGDVDINDVTQIQMYAAKVIDSLGTEA